MSARNNADQVVFGVRSLTFTSGAKTPGRILGALLAIGRLGVLVKRDNGSIFLLGEAPCQPRSDI